jgi:hypothetical protein
MKASSIGVGDEAAIISQVEAGEAGVVRDLCLVTSDGDVGDGPGQHLP